MKLFKNIYHGYSFWRWGYTPDKRFWYKPELINSAYYKYISLGGIEYELKK